MGGGRSPPRPLPTPGMAAPSQEQEGEGRRGLLSASKPGHSGQMGATRDRREGERTAAPKHRGSQDRTGCLPVGPHRSSAPSPGAPHDLGLGNEPPSLWHHCCGSDPCPQQPWPLRGQHLPDYHKYSQTSWKAGQQPGSPSAATGSTGAQACGHYAACSRAHSPHRASPPPLALPPLVPAAPPGPPAVLPSGSTSPMLLSIYGNTSSSSAKDTIIKAH